METADRKSSQGTAQDRSPQQDNKMMTTQRQERVARRMHALNQTGGRASDIYIYIERERERKREKERAWEPRPSKRMLITQVCTSRALLHRLCVRICCKHMLHAHQLSLTCLCGVRTELMSLAACCHGWPRLSRIDCFHTAICKNSC